uniref:amidohydrolase family protein n=1 Tax=Anaplasma marginale TaxID=770 RepID=UPI001145EFE4
ELNQWNIGVLDKNPGCFCFAAFHPGDDDALDMIEDILDHLQMLGVKLQLLVQNFYPYDDRLMPLYELILERNKRILFHAGTGPVGNEFVGYDNFIPVMDRFPELHTTVAHMGALEYEKFIELPGRYANFYLDTSFAFWPHAEGHFSLGNEVLEQNRSRILYGSDYPNIIFSREEEINYLYNQNLSEEFYQRVFYQNGIDLLKIHAGLSD